MNSFLKKFFVLSLVAVTVAMNFASFTVSPAKALAAGDLVKGPNSDAVYYIGANGKKYVFPDSKTYFTWYKNFNGVKTVTISELDNYPAGGAVTYRAGTKLVKTVDSNKVYAVEPGGSIRWITSEATAIALWGANWAKMVNDVIPGYFFSTYTVGSDLGTTYPTGTLVQKNGDATIYYVDGTSIRPFATGDAFTVNSFDFAFIVKTDSLSGYTTGSSITGAESALSSISASANVPQLGGSVMVSLASDTPASGLVVAKAARYPFTKVNFTNTGTVDVTVDQVIVKRAGLASDSDFADLDLLRASDNQPLNSSSKTIGSEHTATFNDDWTIPANSTIGVVLAGNMASDLSTLAGEVPVLALQAVTLKGGATLSGSLPIMGNYQTTNGTITIGTATIAAGGQNPSATTKEVGTTNYIVSSFKVTAGGQEDLTIKSVTLTNNGSTAASDLKNVKLINANTNATVGTMATITGKRMTFSNINYILGKGKNVTFDVRVDIDGGSARTISMDIDQQSDLVVSGNTYGYNILPTYPNSSSPYFNGNDINIGNGTLRIESVSIPQTNVSEGLTQVTLGKFKFVAKGEAMNVTNIGWNFILTTTSASADFTDITNVSVYGPDGNVVAGPRDLPSISYTAAGMKNTATTTDTITVPIGESVYTVKADLSSDFTANDTIQVGVETGAITAKGDVTGNSLDSTHLLPGTNVQSSTMTIKAASLAVTVGTTPSTQTVVAGAQDFTVATYDFSAVNSGTNIEITSVNPSYHTTGNAFPNLLSGFTLWDGATQIGINSDSTTCSGATCSTTGTNATTTLTLNDNALIIPAGTSKTITVKADIGTGATSGSFSVGLHNVSGSATSVAAVDSEAQSITPTVTNGDGQAMNLAAGGTLNVAISSDPKANNYVSGSTVEVGRFTAQAKYEGVNFNYIGLSIAAPAGGIAGNYEDVTSLSLWDGSTNLGQVNISGANATITPTSMNLTVNQEKTYVVKATFASVATPSAAASGEGLKVTVTNLDVDGTSAGSSSISVSGLGASFNDTAIFKSLPTVSKIDFTGGSTITGNDTINLYKFSVAADSAGPVALYRLSFGVSTTTVNLSNTGFYLYESTSASSLGDIVAKGGDIDVVNDATGGKAILRVYFDVNDDSPAHVGEHRILNAGTTRYYTLRGTIASGHDGSTTAESISTVMAGDAAYADTTQLTAAGAATVDDDFTWSDLNFDLYSTTTATNNVGWFNGFRVPGLDANTSTAQVVSK